MTPESDYERLAMNVYAEHGENISDRDTFDFFYDKYLVEVENSLTNEYNRDKTWNHYRRIYRIPDARIHKEGGGKDFAKDKQKTAKTVVKSVEEYKKKGAGRVDYKGYDTKKPFKRRTRDQMVRDIAKEREYSVIGYQKGLVRNARKTKIKWKGREGVVRYVDRRGKYVSIKKKR